MFVKLQHRPTPSTALPFSSFLAAALLPRRSEVETFERSNVLSIYPFCPQTLTDLPTQRPQPKPFEINAFRIVSLATEDIPLSSHSGTHPRLCTHLSFQSLAGIHFATPFFSNSCRNGGCTPLPVTSDRTGTLTLSSLSATLMNLPASVANKRLNLKTKLFGCNTYKKLGGGGVCSSAIFRRLDFETFERSDGFKERRRGSDRSGRRRRDSSRGKLGRWADWGRWAGRGLGE